ncbi:hypothetical protein QQF64_034436, partial [Cirrhinus molitorella]
MLLLFLLLLFIDGVSGADETESVMEGDSVTLHTDLTEIQNDDTILWMFGPKDSIVSQITRKSGMTSFFVTDDVGFRGRLQVDQKTGSLTIRNTRIRHSGKYKLTVSREKTTTTIFNVTVFGVVGQTDEVMSETVMEGESVTLKNNVLVERDDLIVWRFGDKGILIAKIDVESKEISLNDVDERFRDRLQLNQNGSLIIKKTKTENAGFYELQIRGRESSQRFLLSVTAVPGLGLPPGFIAGIVVAILVVAAALVAVVIYYNRKITVLKEKMEKKIKPMEGESITLPTDLNDLKTNKVQWYYKDNCIAEIDGSNKSKKVLPGPNRIFSGKLKLKENGSLKITDITSNHSGCYKLEIHKNGTPECKTIAVSVQANDTQVNKGESVCLPAIPDSQIQK